MEPSSLALVGLAAFLIGFAKAGVAGVSFGRRHRFRRLAFTVVSCHSSSIRWHHGDTQVAIAEVALPDVKWGEEIDPVDMAGRDEAIETIARGIEQLGADHYRDWLPGSLSDRVRDLARLQERLEAEYVRCLAEWDHQRAWEVDGPLSPAGWLAHNTPVTRSRAHRQVRTARVIHDHGDTAQALRAGVVSVTQAETVARAGGQGRDELLTEHERVLLDAASTMGEDDFEQLVKQWNRMADDQLGRASTRHIYENRYLHLHATFAGAVVVDGRLDPAAGAKLQAALEKRVRPDPTDDPDPRTAAQLRADALIDMVDDAESATASKRRSKVRANVNVIVDLPTLQGEGWASRSRAELVGIGPAALETVRRLLCDSHLTRIVTNGTSQVLDVGRNSRFVSEPQRAALIVRDGGCVFPSCNRDHRWCDAHHLTPYVESNRTDLPDLVLLCTRHHTAVHEGGWSLDRDPETGAVHIAPPESEGPESAVEDCRGRAPP